MFEFSLVVVYLQRERGHLLTEPIILGEHVQRSDDVSRVEVHGTRRTLHELIPGF